MNKEIIDLGRDLHHFVNLSNLNENSVIVDAGANVGNFIKAIREHLHCPIFAIECSKQNLEFINDCHFEDVVIIEKALVGEHREVTLVEYSGELKADGTKRYNQWSNIYDYHGHLPGASQRKYSVETITIQDILSSVGEIDYLKVDIEGSEYEVIESLSVEDAKKIKQLSMETHYPEQNESLKSNLKALGFALEEKLNNELYCWRVL